MPYLARVFLSLSMRQTLILLSLLLFSNFGALGQDYNWTSDPFCSCYNSVLKSNGQNFNDEYHRYLDTLIDRGILASKEPSAWMGLLDSLANSETYLHVPEPDNPIFLKFYFVCNALFSNDSSSATRMAFNKAAKEAQVAADYSQQFIGKVFLQYVHEGMFEEKDAQLRLLLILAFVNEPSMGIAQKRPILPPLSSKSNTLNTDNVLNVLVNGQDELLVNGKLTRLEDLKGIVVEFLTDTSGEEGHPRIKYVESEFGRKKTTGAIVSLKNERSTTYKMYVAVYNELLAGYNEVRSMYSQKYFNMPYLDLENSEKNFIRKLVPIKISEAEPVSTD